MGTIGRKSSILKIQTQNSDNKISLISNHVINNSMNEENNNIMKKKKKKQFVR